MSREVCGDEEDFVRGITSAQFDDGELSSEFFSGKAVSVSRLCVANERDSVALLKEILERSPSGVSWKGYATFGHSALKLKTAEYVAGNKSLKDARFTIWVEKDATTENPGHAEVMPRVPRGLAKHLLHEIDFFRLCLETAA